MVESLLQVAGSMERRARKVVILHAPSGDVRKAASSLLRVLAALRLWLRTGVAAGSGYMAFPGAGVDGFESHPVMACSIQARSPSDFPLVYYRCQRYAYFMAKLLLLVFAGFGMGFSTANLVTRAATERLRAGMLKLVAADTKLKEASAKLEAVDARLQESDAQLKQRDDELEQSSLRLQRACLGR